MPFPLLRLCINPALDEDYLHSIGYEDIGGFLIGVNASNKFVGWTGNTSLTVNEVLTKAEIVNDIREVVKEIHFNDKVMFN